jgi:hypothetical protein
MQPYELISKDWILSGIARRVYRIAAGLSLTLYLSLVEIGMRGPTPFLKQFVFLGILGTAINGVGMEFFLFRFDESPAWKQIVWFCVMLFVPLGPALYCYCVYSRSQVLKAARTSSSERILGGSKPIG